MRGSVYRQCWCRNPETGKRYTKEAPCPKMKSPKHGKWYARYDTSVAGSRRQPVLGPFDMKREAEEELAAALTAEGGGGPAADRTLRAVDYLDDYLLGKRNLKQSSRESYEEAFRLYWKPGLGPRVRLTDLRDRHVSAVIGAMLELNRPLPEEKKPSEILRRMNEARGDGEPDGRSARLLSPSRIERMFAPFRAAMTAAVKTGKIGRNPCLGVELPAADKPVPLAWTAARERKFRADLARRLREAEAALPAGRVLTTVARQEIWAATDLRPCPVMVWTPAHAGQFLDYLDDLKEQKDQEEERLAPLFAVTMLAGFRRDEVLGLTWSEVDLDEGVAFVRKTASGSGPKSGAGKRDVPLGPDAVAMMRAWRKVQAASRLSWGPDWCESDLVFTREDGTPVPAQWTSRRFETLAYRSGLPPVRFHDLRHGTASLMKGAGVDTKVISARLGHSRTDFTNRTYVTLFPEIEKAAAEAAEAIIPRRLPRPSEGAR